MKTSELQGVALDWAVDKAKNINTPYSSWGQKGKVPAYCTDWAAGGLIIEREGICTSTEGIIWMAWVYDYDGLEMLHIEHGPTPLIAAMRCYVASKLGDNTDIPEELK